MLAWAYLCVCTALYHLLSCSSLPLSVAHPASVSPWISPCPPSVLCRPFVLAFCTHGFASRCLSTSVCNVHSTTQMFPSGFVMYSPANPLPPLLPLLLLLLLLLLLRPLHHSFHPLDAFHGRRLVLKGGRAARTFMHATGNLALIKCRQAPSCGNHKITLGWMAAWNQNKRQAP